MCIYIVVMVKFILLLLLLIIITHAIVLILVLTLFQRPDMLEFTCRLDPCLMIIQNNSLPSIFFHSSLLYKSLNMCIKIKSTIPLLPLPLFLLINFWLLCSRQTKIIQQFFKSPLFKVKQSFCHIIIHTISCNGNRFQLSIDFLNDWLLEDNRYILGSCIHKGVDLSPPILGYECSIACNRHHVSFIIVIIYQVGSLEFCLGSR
mmetsp:Transcript_3020/g.5642  ORF Transcript_3020/g.5642 Transcript_3020/m.5642 type:complete len:204 (+) Transcript_3020:1115-1726(+)